MNKRIKEIIKLLKKFDKKKLPIELINTNITYLNQQLIMILKLEKEMEE